MRILYVGRNAGTSALRAHALRRIGHEVIHVDPYAALPKAAVAAKWAFHTGALGFASIIERYVDANIASERFDIAFVDNGDLISKALVKHLKLIASVVLVFNQDNPFATRDGYRWRLFWSALPEYDLFVTPRESNIEPALAAGARNALRVWFSADEVLHQPPDMTDDELRDYQCDIAFVGTWMPERGPFLSRLIELGLSPRIMGPRWSKAPEFKDLEPYVHSGELVGSSYVKAIFGSKISIALLSQGNADLHTTRSMEIPAIGSLLCGERTSEHLALYREGTEAVFWRDADECAEICISLLKDQERLRRISRAGYLRAQRNGHFNEPTLGAIIDKASSL